MDEDGTGNTCRRAWIGIKNEVRRAYVAMPRNKEKKKEREWEKKKKKKKDAGIEISWTKAVVKS